MPGKIEARPARRKPSAPDRSRADRLCLNAVLRMCRCGVPQASPESMNQHAASQYHPFG